MTQKTVPPRNSRNRQLLEARVEFEKLLKRLHASVSQHWTKNGALPADDSEADGMWLRLQDRGLTSPLLPSQRYTLLANALLLADTEGLDEMLKLRWCSDCIRAPDVRDAQTMQGRLAAWTQENMRKDNEALSRTA